MFFIIYVFGGKKDGKVEVEKVNCYYTLIIKSRRMKKAEVDLYFSF